MPVISMCSPKGGAGKTTTATLVATVVADQGESVTIFDADPNKAVMRWATRPGVPKTSPSSMRTLIR
jgi:chromosome partitioning protein